MHTTYGLADLRRKVLARARLGILRVLLQQALVGVAFHVGAHRHEDFLVAPAGTARLNVRPAHVSLH